MVASASRTNNSLCYNQVVKSKKKHSKGILVLLLSEPFLASSVCACVCVCVCVPLRIVQHCEGRDGPAQLVRRLSQY